MQKRLLATPLLFICILFSLQVAAQISNCSAILNTEVKGKIIEIKSTQSSLTLNSKSGELTLRIPLNSLDTDLDTLNAFFDTQTESIVFLAKLDGDIYNIINQQDNSNINQQENSNENFPLTGSLTLNRFTNEAIGNYSITKLSNTREDPYRNLRLSLSLKFSPKPYGLQKYLPQFTKDISIRVNEGILNVVD